MSYLGYLNPRYAPTERVTNREILWAAGFWEGDGTCSRHKNSESAGASQKDRWPLEIMKKYFGGSISTQGPNLWQWYVHGARARGFLQTIYGLVSPRRQGQISRMLEWK